MREVLRMQTTVVKQVKEFTTTFHMQKCIALSIVYRPFSFVHKTIGEGYSRKEAAMLKPGNLTRGSCQLASTSHENTIL